MPMVLLRGIISRIGERERKTEKLEIMKFILETDGGPIEIELTNKSIDFFMNSRKVNDKIGVNVEIKGRLSHYNGKDNYFTSLRCANTFPIFTRGDEAPGFDAGMAGGANGNANASTYSSNQGNSSYGAQNPSFPTAEEDDLPF
jgi:hypothetical protein